MTATERERRIARMEIGRRLVSLLLDTEHEEQREPRPDPVARQAFCHGYITQGVRSLARELLTDAEFKTFMKGGK